MNFGSKSIVVEVAAILALSFVFVACAATTGGWILSYVRFV